MKKIIVLFILCFPSVAAITNHIALTDITNGLATIAYVDNTTNDLTDLTTVSNQFLLKSGDTMSGDLDMNGHSVHHVDSIDINSINSLDNIDNVDNINNLEFIMDINNINSVNYISKINRIREISILNKIDSNVSMENNVISNLADGVSVNDAVNLGQVQAMTNGCADLYLKKSGDTGGSLTLTNLTTINSINDFVNSNFKAGSSAGYSASGNNNSYIGSYTGFLANGNNNSYLGLFAGYSANGHNNNYLGNSAGYLARGDYNSYLGNYAGYLASGNYNSYLGDHAGQYSISTNNLYLGNYAGHHQTNSSRAYFGNYVTIDCNTARVVNISAGVDPNDAVSLGQVQAMTNDVITALTTTTTSEFDALTNALKQAGVF